MTKTIETSPFVALLAEMGEGLVRIPLAKIGTWFKGKQKFTISRADVASIVANFKARANGEVPLDYDHGIEFAAGTGQPVPASGWLKEIDEQPDENGVLWGGVEFTATARLMVAAKEYRYISPVIKWGVPDKATGKPLGAMITSVALTNVPVLDEMPALALSEGWVAEATETRREKRMSMKLILADRAACTVRVVGEDGTESVLSVEGLTPEPKVLRLSDVGRGSDGRYDFSKLPQDGLIAGDVILAMSAQQELDGAVAAGKILPAQRAMYEKLALSDLAGFRTLVASMKQQVELGERGFAGGEQAGTIDQVDSRLEQLIGEKLKGNAELGRVEATRLVLSENPDLVQRRRELMR